MLGTPVVGTLGFHSIGVLEAGGRYGGSASCFLRYFDYVQVCFYREDEADGEALARCRECAMPVHPTCYGLAPAPPPAAGPAEAASEGGRAGGSGAGALAGDGTFLCRTCEYGVRHAACDLCPLVGGALKICADGGYRDPTARPGHVTPAECC